MKYPIKKLTSVLLIVIIVTLMVFLFFQSFSKVFSNCEQASITDCLKFSMNSLVSSTMCGVTSTGRTISLGIPLRMKKVINFFTRLNVASILVEYRSTTLKNPVELGYRAGEISNLCWNQFGGQSKCWVLYGQKNPYTCGEINYQNIDASNLVLKTECGEKSCNCDFKVSKSGEFYYDNGKKLANDLDVFYSKPLDTLSKKINYLNSETCITSKEGNPLELDSFAFKGINLDPTTSSAPELLAGIKKNKYISISSDATHGFTLKDFLVSRNFFSKTNHKKFMGELKFAENKLIKDLTCDLKNKNGEFISNTKQLCLFEPHFFITEFGGKNEILHSSLKLTDEKIVIEAKPQVLDSGSSFYPDKTKIIFEPSNNDKITRSSEEIEIHLNRLNFNNMRKILCQDCDNLINSDSLKDKEFGLYVDIYASARYGWKNNKVVTYLVERDKNPEIRLGSLLSQQKSSFEDSVQPCGNYFGDFRISDSDKANNACWSYKQSLGACTVNCERPKLTSGILKLGYYDKTILADNPDRGTKEDDNLLEFDDCSGFGIDKESTKSVKLYPELDAIGGGGKHLSKDYLFTCIIDESELVDGRWDLNDEGEVCNEEEILCGGRVQ